MKTLFVLFFHIFAFNLRSFAHEKMPYSTSKGR